MEQELQMEMEGAGTAGGGAGPKACTTCRLAHISCDRSVLDPLLWELLLLFLLFGWCK
jgi:hypothetical protein